MDALIYIVLISIGTLIAPAINWAIYSWTWFPRRVSPWSKVSDDELKTLGDKAVMLRERSLADRIPIFGWIRLQREYEVWGRMFWLRPFLIELSFGLLLAALYWWEVDKLALLPPQIVAGIPAALTPRLDAWMQIMFLGHAILLVLLTVATFIDFDDKTIPDAVTIPGTLIGLLLAVVGVYALPPNPASPILPAGSSTFLPWIVPHETGTKIEALFYCSPHVPHVTWFGSAGLTLGLAIFATWVFSLSDRRLIVRRGLLKAVSYFFVRWWRRNRLQTSVIGLAVPIWIVLLAILAFGGGGITWTYLRGGDAWLSLLSALIGMGIGGGQIWAVRVFAGVGLGKEAMGFGDVTLMAMVGAFVGWQVALFAFFLAPFTAILIVVTSWILTGQTVLPFGPYLAAGTMISIVFWDRMWNGYAAQVFVLGPVIGAILAFFLVVMFVLLVIIRIAKQAFGLTE